MQCTCNWHTNGSGLSGIEVVDLECPTHGIYDPPTCLTCRDNLVIYQSVDTDPVGVVELVECPDCTVKEDA